jgi:hypothetical protein
LQALRKSLKNGQIRHSGSTASYIEKLKLVNCDFSFIIPENLWKYGPANMRQRIATQPFLG